MGIDATASLGVRFSVFPISNRWRPIGGGLF